MDFVNQIIKLVTDFATKSEATYHVNPWIFCVLFFGSALPLYYGYYRIGKSVIKIEDGKITRKHLNKKELKIGVAITITAWWIPYLYVVLFGKLPLNLWLVFLSFVLVMGIFFMKTLISRITKVKIDNN
ncbi:MAG: hypothetical protein WCJ36_02475 [Candidatus Saccharibacteria bacterium]